MDALMAVKRGVPGAQLPALRPRRVRQRRRGAGAVASEDGVGEGPARSDVAPTTQVPAPPFWGDRIVKGIALAEYAGYLDERATFMGQWGLRASRGGEGPSVRGARRDRGPAAAARVAGADADRGTARGRRRLRLLPVRVSEGDDLVVLAPRTAPSGTGSPSPGSAGTGDLCLADFFRPRDEAGAEVRRRRLPAGHDGAADRARPPRSCSRRTPTATTWSCTACPSSSPRRSPSTGTPGCARTSASPATTTRRWTASCGRGTAGRATRSATRPARTWRTGPSWSTLLRARADRRRAVRGAPAAPRAVDRRAGRAPPRGEVLQRHVSVASLPRRPSCGTWTAPSSTPSRSGWPPSTTWWPSTAGAGPRSTRTPLVGNALLVSAEYLAADGGVDLPPAVIVEQLIDGVVAEVRAARALAAGARELLRRAARGRRAVRPGDDVLPLARRRGRSARVPGGTFAAVVTGDEVRERQAAPRAVPDRAALLGVTPRRCVAIEDSPDGGRLGAGRRVRRWSRCRTWCRSRPGRESSCSTPSRDCRPPGSPGWQGSRAGRRPRPRGPPGTGVHMVAGSDWVAASSRSGLSCRRIWRSGWSGRQSRRLRNGVCTVAAARAVGVSRRSVLTSCAGRPPARHRIAPRRATADDGTGRGVRLGIPSAARGRARGHGDAHRRPVAGPDRLDAAASATRWPWPAASSSSS